MLSSLLRDGLPNQHNQLKSMFSIFLNFKFNYHLSSIEGGGELSFNQTLFLCRLATLCSLDIVILHIQWIRNF